MDIGPTGGTARPATEGPSRTTSPFPARPRSASYGGSDRSLRGAGAKLESALTRVDVPHDVKEYPTAGHAFMNTGPAPWSLQKLTGITHNPAASTDTWRRVDDFFTEHLAETASERP